MAIEAYVPVCANCRMRHDLHAVCTLQDYLTDHEYPCGHSTAWLQEAIALSHAYLTIITPQINREYDGVVRIGDEFSRLFFVSIPTPNGERTNLPLIISVELYNDEQFVEFLEQNFDKSTLAFLNTAWESKWKNFWENLPLNDQEWLSLHSAYWSNIVNQTEVDETTLRLIGKFQLFAQDLFLSLYQDWIASKN